MTNLPRKIFLLFLIVFPLLISANQAIAAPVSNPQEIFYPPLKGYIDNKINTFIKAKETVKEDGKGQVVIEKQGVGNFALGSSFFNLGNMVVNSCVGMPGCPDQTTALDSIGQMMVLMYSHPPASGLAYTYDLVYNAGLLAKPVFAQGIGFSALAPFLPFWKVTRNIAYMLLIVVMVAIGFMIIFRTKIDPKTVIGVQAALPKIVLTLILITFSYPIVGFMIDLMYLTMAMAISLMVSGAGGEIGGTKVTNIQSTYLTAGAADLFGAVFWPLGGFLSNLAGTIGIGSGVASGLHLIQWVLLHGPSLPFIGLTGGLLAAAAIPIIIFVIISLGLLYTAIRLFLLLANSYIQLVVSLILGPILLLGEAIPGKSAFSNWFQNIIANLVVFPATAMIMLFSVWLVTLPQSTSAWAPPFLGNFNPAGGAFHSFLGLAVMFMAPNLVASIKKAFHPKPVVPASVGSAFAPVTGTVGTAMGAGQTFFYSKSMVDTIVGLVKGKPPGQSG